jgi:hypothetical protein
LKHLTETLIGPSGTAGQWLQASQELYELLLEVSGLDKQDSTNLQDISLETGKALAPVWAAHCILDFMRTRAFMQGILQAIDTMGKRFPNTKIHVLYAGPGPFATLVLPLFPLLDPEKVQFTLVEISPRSVSCLKNLVKAFAFEPWIREITCADATTYQADASTPPHLVIAEMLQAGLRREPQVAATLHLAPQIAVGGALIPQRIRLQAGLLSPERNQERMTRFDDFVPQDVFQLLGPVFDLTQHTVLPLSGAFPAVTVAIPEHRNAAFSTLALFTEIEIFESIYLDIWQSGLTNPLILDTLSANTPPKQARFQYLPGKDPGLEWHISAAGPDMEIELFLEDAGKQE